MQRACGTKTSGLPELAEGYLTFCSTLAVGVVLMLPADHPVPRRNPLDSAVPPGAPCSSREHLLGVATQPLASITTMVQASRYALEAAGKKPADIKQASSESVQQRPAGAMPAATRAFAAESGPTCMQARQPQLTMSPTHAAIASRTAGNDTQLHDTLRDNLPAKRHRSAALLAGTSGNGPSYSGL